jgi:hypothetical protein
VDHEHHPYCTLTCRASPPGEGVVNCSVYLGPIVSIPSRHAAHYCAHTANTYNSQPRFPHWVDPTIMFPKRSNGIYSWSMSDNVRAPHYSVGSWYIYASEATIFLGSSDSKSPVGSRISPVIGRMLPWAHAPTTTTTVCTTTS